MQSGGAGAPMPTWQAIRNCSRGLNACAAGRDSVRQRAQDIRVRRLFSTDDTRRCCDLLDFRQARRYRLLKRPVCAAALCCVPGVDLRVVHLVRDVAPPPGLTPRVIARIRRTACRWKSLRSRSGDQHATGWLANMLAERPSLRQPFVVFRCDMKTSCRIRTGR